MECKLCHKDKSLWTEIMPIKVRPDDHVNDKVDVCLECLEQDDIDSIREKLIVRGH